MFEDLRKSADVNVLPQNWPVLQCFSDLQTQWRSNMGGATGLDYTAIPIVLDRHGIFKPKKRAQVFDGIRIMEAEALAIFAERREQ